MKILITSGGTSEQIDTVRKITNSSSGKLGALIAERLHREGHEIYYVHSKKAVMPAISGYHNIEIIGTMDLKRVMEEILTTQNIDWVIHSMAVSDYVVSSVTTADMLSANLKERGVNSANIINNPKTLNRLNKISSNEENLVIVLEKAPKIIGMIKQLSPKTKLVGFKLLSHATPMELNKAAANLRDKNDCEFVVANDLSQINENEHLAFFVGKEGIFYKAGTKQDISNKLAEIIRKKQEDG